MGSEMPLNAGKRSPSVAENAVEPVVMVNKPYALTPRAGDASDSRTPAAQSVSPQLRAPGPSPASAGQKKGLGFNIANYSSPQCKLTRSQSLSAGYGGGSYSDLNSYLTNGNGTGNGIPGKTPSPQRKTRTTARKRKSDPASGVAVPQLLTCTETETEINTETDTAGPVTPRAVPHSSRDSTLYPSPPLSLSEDTARGSSVAVTDTPSTVSSDTKPSIVSPARKTDRSLSGGAGSPGYTAGMRVIDENTIRDLAVKEMKIVELKQQIDMLNAQLKKEEADLRQLRIDIRDKIVRKSVQEHREHRRSLSIQKGAETGVGQVSPTSSSRGRSGKARKSDEISREEPLQSSGRDKRSSWFSSLTNPLHILSDIDAILTEDPQDKDSSQSRATGANSSDNSSLAKLSTSFSSSLRSIYADIRSMTIQETSETSTTSTTSPTPLKGSSTTVVDAQSGETIASRSSTPRKTSPDTSHP